MDFRKYVPPGNTAPISIRSSNFSSKENKKSNLVEWQRSMETDVDVDLGEVYFLIMHFLSGGPCQRTYGQLCDELLEHQLLPRRYHAWHSHSGMHHGDKNDDGSSFPLTYSKLVERYPHIDKDHLVKLLKQLLLGGAVPSQSLFGGNALGAAAVPTLLGTGSFSLLPSDQNMDDNNNNSPPGYMRWPHRLADQVRGLRLREIGGGFPRHNRAPSIRAACYAVAKPSTMVQKMQHVTRVRGHHSAVYCATFDRSGRYVITGSDDRLVKVWSMETAYCLASCRGHEGDITDLAVNFNNTLVASASNDCVIRVWRLPDGLPISVLRGHTGAVTAIAFNPRPGTNYQLLSSSDDGTCRMWDARYSQLTPRLYVPKPSDPLAGRTNVPSSSTVQQSHQIFCCAFNASGTVFVTGSSDTLARVWNACKSSTDDLEQPNHEIDILAGHENDVNYVQFSGCTVPVRYSPSEASKEDTSPKFKNTWFNHDNIVTCSRDGSAIIWIPRSRRSRGKIGRWIRAYHLKVPPPPMPPQPPRGPRQRILPTPRGVNMIAWSLDNRFVLAAIMDCRICVWNAVDGSLVHSLTGHTESTYILDVHPFNPRIAMSAGYDGKTIVWDIWEGTPIRTYQIGQFKLVDGKFSPDGTSIILSDDAGQLCILNTGQGEAHRHAKYDQFFLGDYRPLIQDTHGNVLDQETQLAPYRRNMQDLLCDSGMIPYPEPYQNAYQLRRLGALGLEWRPSPLRFAIGIDFSSDPDYHMLPIVDLDTLIVPLPEYVDALDWAPEIEIFSDDNDSEYRMAEDYSSGGENVSLSLDGGEAESSSEGNDVEHRRRSKKKKQKTEAEITTSSGRRVKRKNLGEGEDSAIRVKSRTRKSRSRLSSKKYLSNLRPQRAAARNALHLFSRITGTYTNGVVNGSSDSDTSETSSTLQDSISAGDESDVSLQNEFFRSLKGKEISIEGDQSHLYSESKSNASNKRRLMLKLPCRDSGKNVFAEELGVLAYDDSREICNKQPDLNLFKDGQIRWGGFKTRTSKRLKIEEPEPNNVNMNRGSNNNNNNNNSGNINNDNTENLERAETSEKYLEESKEDESFSLSRAACNGTPVSPANVTQNNIQLTENEIRALKELPIRCPTDTLGEITVDYSGNATKSPTDHDTPESLQAHACDLARKQHLDEKEQSGALESGGQDQVHGLLSGSVLKETLRPDPNDRMFGVVYRRSKCLKGKLNAEYEHVNMEASTSNVEARNLDEGIEGTPEGSRRARSIRLRSSTHRDPIVSPINFKESDDDLENNSIDGEMTNLTGEKNCKEQRSESRNFIRSRSTRKKKGTNYVRDSSPIGRRKSVNAGKSSWLLLSAHEEGSRYIPQRNDEVVYLRQGHQEYINYSNSRNRGPWETIKQNIRAVEFCKIEDLDYATHPGSGESCCKLTLKFTDPSSEALGKSFNLTLPEVTGFPDFLVEKSWYDASMARNWTTRDKCQVWWKNEGDENGSWWDGRILSINPKSVDFLDSPWERYAVKYKSDPTDIHHHSPWELYDTNTQWDPPHIDDDVKEKLLLAFAKLEKSACRAQDHYGVNKLKLASQKTSFINRFPVPLSLEVIHSRLQNNYYRSLEAMKHDIEVMLSNAETYFGRKAELSSKVKRLSEWFRKTLPS